jgi:tetratricopeptide (TPR) repeat protein
MSPQFKSALLIWLLSISVICQAQQDNELLKIKGDSAKIITESLSVDIRVTGTFATTTVAMTFYNPFDRILEGELNFPLGDGQQVFRFAMDLNGKLREGVMVDKDKGRKTFERIVRQQVDPALLEMTTGNNYKARVYPIPARGYKTIVLAYEEELVSLEPTYHLTMKYGQAKNFKLNVEVDGEAQPKIIDNKLNNFHFKKWNTVFKATHEAKDFCACMPLRFAIPALYTEGVSIEQKKADTSFFSINVLPPVTKQTKPAPQRIALVWDASHSGNERDIKRELEVLGRYFQWLQNAQVTFLAFSNSLHTRKVMQIQNGEWKEVRRLLEKVVYDGGTNPRAINFHDIDADEILLFSDALFNLGTEFNGTPKARTYAISTNPKARHDALRSLAEPTGGRYINLISTSPEQAMELLTHQVFRFISAQYPKNITEVYPARPSPVNGPFTIGGIIKGRGTITLEFGVGTEVSYRKKITLNSEVTTAGAPVSRLWAKEKIKHLLRYEAAARGKVVDLASQHHIITPFTSLIVLDRVEDYVTYEITPPDELLEEYLELMAEKQDESSRDKEEILEMAIEDFSEHADWWKDNEKDSKMEKVSTQPAPTPTQPVQPSHPSQNSINHRIPTPGQQNSTDSPGVTTGPYNKQIQGTIFDDTGSPMPGVNVLLKGTAHGTVTDAEGNFQISIPEGGVLVLTFIGYVSQELLPTTSTLDIQLNPDVQRLEEVVVSGYAEVRRADVTSAVTTLLTGRVAGVSVTSADSDLHEVSWDLQEWTPQTPYIDSLRKAPKHLRYQTYLRLKKDYQSTPSFFLICGNFFIAEGEPETGTRILTNIAEMELENHELLKALSYRLIQLGETEPAIAILEKVLEIRGNEPQSYRDLALACIQQGNYQRALDLFMKVILMDSDENYWDDRFPLFKNVVIDEMNHLIARHKGKLDLSSVPEDLRLVTPVDLKIIIDWTSLETDIDLWVTEPNGEKCYYRNRLTALGGMLVEDYTEGYGPEVYLLKKAAPGTYKIAVDFYDDRQQKIAGPATLQVTVIKYYGSKREERKQFTVQLESEQVKNYTIGEVKF